MDAPADRRSADAALQVERLQAFVRAMLPIAIAFDLVYVGAAVLLRSTAFAGGAAVVLGYAVTLLVARRMLGRGELERAAVTLAVAIDVMALLGACTVHFLLPALLMMPLAAVALALPYVTGRALRGVVLGSFVADLAVVTIGLAPPLLPQPPTWLQQVVIACAVAATAYLTLFLLWQDATRLRASLEATAAGEARYRLLAERWGQLATGIAQVVWLTDPAGVIREPSASWAAFTGQPFAELQERGWLEAVHPDDRETVLARWREATAAGAVYEAEYRLRRPDGSYTHVLAQGAPVRDETGAIREWVGMITDVSERKAAESALAEQNRRKDEFLAMLGHELRNPLAPIVSALALLERRGAFSPELDVIRRHTRHINRLVDDLLDVGRITQGKITLRTEPVALAEVVERAVETARPLVEARGHALHVHIPPTAQAEGDRVRLAQVVANLLTNAAKYTPPGGRIDVTATEGPDTVALAVRDSGQGLTPELQATIFEPFVQGQPTIDRSEGGLGLGLTIVRRLVELHGGTVTVTSEGPGRGSEFVLRLPRARGEAASSGPPPGVGGETSARRVLIVDDNVDAAELLAEVVTLFGHDVRTAHDGPSALALALELRPDVVLLDLGLPGMDGYEVARRLRRDHGAALSIVAVTGYGLETDKRRSAEAGFDRHLTKPVDADVVAALLARPPHLGPAS